MKSIISPSLPSSRGPSTLRLRWLMNEQQRIEIGGRLRELRENSPETNRSIGDYVGVAERTVAEWASGRQGMSYDHALKVAELFEVEIDWLWRGREPGEKDLMGALSGGSKRNGPDSAFAQLESVLGELLEGQEEVHEKLDALLAAQAPRRKPGQGGGSVGIGHRS